MKTWMLIIMMSTSTLAETARLEWVAPVPQPNIQSYAVLVYEAPVLGNCTGRNWSKATWENTNSIQTTYVVSRPPGCYEFVISYYINGQIQGCRSNFVKHTIKSGQTALPIPGTPPQNLRIVE